MNPDSLVSCVRAARTLARGVREAMSSEMWEERNTLYGSLATLMFHTRSAKALVDCVRRLPTLYPDEQQQQVK